MDDHPERLPARLGMPVSDGAILRAVKARLPTPQPVPVVPRPSVIGIDEWKRRKNAMNYGTIFVDLERRRVAGCCLPIARPLPRRAGSSYILKQRLSSRDRAGMYADAARRGAPQARQVAEIASTC